MALLIASDFIYHAFRLCGQMLPGFTPSPELMQDALDHWQMMFDTFNARRTMNYTEPDYVFPVTGPGHGSTGNAQTFGGTGYQIGPTALDFVAPRPTKIARMNLSLTANASYPTRIPLSQISMEEWLSIAVVQLVPTAVATVFAYDPQFPNGVIWVWPPLNGNALEIYTWGHLAPPATLAASFSAPPGYTDLVIWQLAARLWPLCSKNMMPERRPEQWIRGQAEIVRQRVAAVNAPKPRIANDFSTRHNNGVGTSDWQLLLTGIPY